MLTAQRRMEIGALEWSEVHAGKRPIELPAARCKNDKPHIIPLSEPALALLPARADKRYVFGPFTNWQRSKASLDKRAPLPPWTLHDIRRSEVTHMADLKFALPHVIVDRQSRVGAQVGRHRDLQSRDV